MRSFSSGAEMMTALAHDFVLRRNCRVAANSKNPGQFTITSNGSHHVGLVGHIAGVWNGLVEKEKGGHVGKLIALPELQVVDSGERFGLVVSEFTSSFKGLLEIKEEDTPEDEVLDQLAENEVDAEEILRTLNIDPALINIAQTRETPPALGPSTSSTPAIAQINNSESETSTVIRSQATSGTLRATSSKRKLTPDVESKDGKDNEPESSTPKKARTNLPGTTITVSQQI